MRGPRPDTARGSTDRPERADSAAARRSAAVGFGGTWDLYWSVGPDVRPSGYLVITQRGDSLHVEIHGQGRILATGRASGDTFTVTGRRIASYELSGRLVDGRLVGVLTVLSVTRPFTGRRRP
jgi:hypothetical protein